MEGRKTTTIREKAWPIGIPIMLYNWTGKAYRSKQANVAAVIVDDVRQIKIMHRYDGTMTYDYLMRATDGFPLHKSEGFSSHAAMDEWFRPLVKRGTKTIKHLMRFRLVNSKLNERP